jgi:hypothetical protein
MAGFGWAGAAVRGTAVLVVLVVALVVVPNVLVTELTGFGRSTRVAAATLWFTAALAALAWALRRLQARRVI